MAKLWAVPTAAAHNVLYHILSWIWGAGGELLDPEGKTPLFHQEPALSGIRAYFDLYRFMPRNAEKIDEVIDPLLAGRIAATIIGPWGLREIRRRCANAPATIVPTNTPTRTNTPATPTPTPTTGGGACSPVTSTITAPFTYNGAGTFCWQSNNLGAYVNSWNTTSVTINGVNFTNVYVPSSSYPAQQGGYWYVGYNGPYAWSHFEAK